MLVTCVCLDPVKSFLSSRVYVRVICARFSLFQAIKEALDTIAPSLESAEREQDVALNNAGVEEQSHIRKLMAQLNADWNRINGAYNDRHR